MTNMVNQFNQSNPGINVSPVFSGTYPQTLAKVETSIQGGNPPDVAVLNHTAVFDLLGLKAIEPLDDMVTQGDYYPSFTEPQVQSLTGELHSSVRPWFCITTEVPSKTGSDPDHGPSTWDELITTVRHLETGLTGIEVPSDGTLLGVSAFCDRGRGEPWRVTMGST